jgi:hypothetical protein
MSKPAAPLRMPPGAKRTPCADSHCTANGRSSIHRPMWFSGVACTAGFLVGVQRLHQVHLDLEGRAAADGTDVFIDVLALAAEGARHFQAEHVDPKRLQAFLVGPADGDLLDAQHLEWSLHE